MPLRQKVTTAFTLASQLRMILVSALMNLQMSLCGVVCIVRDNNDIVFFASSFRSVVACLNAST